MRLDRTIADTIESMFQFTHPGKGATLMRRFTRHDPSVFQFTHPGKGATLLPIFQSVLQWFQFTHPGKGATPASFLLFEGHRSFNSRTLGRVRLEYTLGRVRQYFVSIHAPWEGCDRCRQQKPRGAEEFQFTHPGKGATNWICKEGGCAYVSIHAPWEGCDSVPSHSRARRGCFNSRTLGRVRP